jgi:hypothetical protein
MFNIITNRKNQLLIVQNYSFAVVTVGWLPNRIAGSSFWQSLLELRIIGNNFGCFPKAISWNYWETRTARLSVRRLG